MTLLEELKQLIEGSNTLSKIEKQLWIETAKHLDEQKRGQLKEIFVKEKEEFEKIQSEYVAQSSEMNKKHITEIKELVVVERKKAVAKEEQVEASKTDQILTQLNNI